MATTSKSITRSMTVGVFRTQAQAQQAVADLRKLGFTDSQIGIVAKHEGAGSDFGIDNDPTHSRWEEGTAIGAATGGAAGVGLGLAVVAGLMTPVGPLIAGGALMGLLASAGTGATIGTIFGGLIGLGVSEEDATFYDSELKSGRYLVTVEAGNRSAEVQTVFERYQGYNRTNAPAMTSTTANPATSSAQHASGTAAARTGATGEQTVRLHEEHLHANKQTVKAGEVDIRKEVHTEHKTISVPVEREELVIERRKVNATGRTGDIGAEEIRIPLKEEKVTVTKDTVVKEEVSVGKRKVQGTETVAGEVRSEELIVESQGKTTIRDDKSGKKS